MDLSLFDLGEDIGASTPTMDIVSRNDQVPFVSILLTSHELRTMMQVRTPTLFATNLSFF